jgi:hypothetical protein
MPWNGHILLHNLVRLVSASSVSTLPDTWQYDGANWTPVPTTNWPGFRFRPAMAPLSSRQHVVFYGGDFDGPTGGNEPVSRSPSPDPLDKPWSTWTYANGNWQRESHLPGPVKPAIIAAAVDTARDRTVLLVDGGWPDRSMSYFQTWVLEGETMRQLPVTNHPPFRDMPTLGYHPGLDRIVMFGGYYLLRDTWVFDGSTWTQDPNPSQPITGNGAGNMYYDPHRSALVLTQNGRSEVWEWRGAGWTERVEARLPAAFNGRWDVVTGFDPVRQRLIACGGSLGVTGNAQDTWEFDGTTWSLVPTAVLPPTPFLPRRLVHVSWLDRMVVIPRQPPWGLLQYDGTTWSPLATERELYNGLAPLQNSHRFPVCYDDKRGELRVLTQTLDYGLVGSQIWNLVSRTLVPTTHQPRLGERLGFGFDLPTRPHAFCLLGLSGDLFPGIDVGAADGRIVPLANDGLFQISLQLGLFTWLDAQGRGSVQLAPIPTNPNLLGMLLHAAGAVLDPATGWVGTVTNRVAIRVAP